MHKITKETIKAVIDADDSIPSEDKARMLSALAVSRVPCWISEAQAADVLDTSQATLNRWRRGMIKDAEPFPFQVCQGFTTEKNHMYDKHELVNWKTLRHYGPAGVTKQANGDIT